MRRVMIHAVAAGGPSVIALFTFLSGCITFDISQPPPPSYHLYHLKLVRKLHVLFFMTLLLIVVIYFNTAQQSALHPLPVLHPALITFLLAFSPTLVAL